MLLNRRVPSAPAAPGPLAPLGVPEPRGLRGPPCTEPSPPAPPPPLLRPAGTLLNLTMPASDWLPCLIRPATLAAAYLTGEIGALGAGAPVSAATCAACTAAGLSAGGGVWVFGKVDPP